MMMGTLFNYPVTWLERDVPVFVESQPRDGWGEGGEGRGGGGAGGLGGVVGEGGKESGKREGE